MRVEEWGIMYAYTQSWDHPTQNQQETGLTAAVELFTDFKRVQQETSYTEIPKVLWLFSCYCNSSRSLAKIFLIFVTRFQQTHRKLFYTTKGNMLAVTIVLSLFVTVVMYVMKLERQHICSPPEQMKISLWMGKMLKYVPLQFQGAVMHLLNIYFYKTNLEVIWVSETRKVSLQTEHCKIDEFV